MKHRFLALLPLLLALAQPATAQLDTTRARYYQPIFRNVTVTQAVPYGSAITAFGQPQTLLMDVYEPAGDTVRRRPLIIFAHEGGFVTGSRTDQYMTDVCTRFARLGYVTASIDYRLLFFPLDSVNIAKAALRASQDMRAAIRFFRQDAATTRQYRVHPSYIAVGGASAGAFMALQVGYLDKASEVPAYVGLAALGGIEGNSGNPGYGSSNILAVLNLSGATEDPAIIEPGNAPLCSLHGTADAVVPYRKGNVGGGLPPKYVYGSALLHPRATQAGIRNVLKTFSGGAHVPQYGTTPAALAYADTTFRVVRDFLRPALGGGTVTGVRGATGRARPAPQAWPVPAEGLVRVLLPEAGPLPAEARLYDAAGRLVRSFRPTSRTLDLTRGSLPAGLYSLKVAGQPAVRIEFR